MAKLIGEVSGKKKRKLGHSASFKTFSICFYYLIGAKYAPIGCKTHKNLHAFYNSFRSQRINLNDWKRSDFHQFDFLIQASAVLELKLSDRQILQADLNA